MSRELDKSEIELNKALCNFCNGAADPYGPASEWNDSVYRSLGKLSMAYNEWYKWLKADARDPFIDR